MKERVSIWFSRIRIATLLSSLFGLVGLLLAAAGMSGVMSYAVTERTREIGIRMALGAHRTDVLKLVIRQGVILTSVGLTIGLIGAFATTRMLSSLLYGIPPIDP